MPQRKRPVVTRNRVTVPNLTNSQVFTMLPAERREAIENMNFFDGHQARMDAWVEANFGGLSDEQVQRKIAYNKDLEAAEKERAKEVEKEAERIRLERYDRLKELVSRKEEIVNKKYDKGVARVIEDNKYYGEYQAKRREIFDFFSSEEQQQLLWLRNDENARLREIHVNKRGTLSEYNEVVKSHDEFWKKQKAYLYDEKVRRLRDIDSKYEVEVSERAARRKREDLESDDESAELYVLENDLSVTPMREQDGKAVQDFRINAPKDSLDVLEYLTNIRNLIFGTIKGLKTNAVKYQFRIGLVFSRTSSKRSNDPIDAVNETIEPLFTELPFPSKNVPVIEGNPSKIAYMEEVEHVVKRIEKWTGEGSGWTIHRINGLGFTTTRFLPLSGSKYEPLPAKIRNKKAIINPKNNDLKCGLWAVAIAKICEIQKDLPDDRKSKDLGRLPSAVRKVASRFDLTGVTFPMCLNGPSIENFEWNNKISICVMAMTEDGNVSIVRHRNHYKDIVTLYLHEDLHFCAVSNISRLLSSKSENKFGNGGNAKHYCMRCTTSYGSERLLSEHEELCERNEVQRCVYPKPHSNRGNWDEYPEGQKRQIVPMKVTESITKLEEKTRSERVTRRLLRRKKAGTSVRYHNTGKEDKCTFVIYGDSECATVPVSGDKRKYQEHKVLAMSGVIKCSDSELYPDKVITVIAESDEEMGDELARKWVRAIENELRDNVYPIMVSMRNRAMMLSSEELRSHEEALDCADCNSSLCEPKMREVRRCNEKFYCIPKKESRNEIGQLQLGSNIVDDTICPSFERYAIHSDTTGKYLRTVCQRCNKRHKSRPYEVSVLFHNLNYDAHMFVRVLGGDVTCIPVNEERYVSFSKNLPVSKFERKNGTTGYKHLRITFKDSWKFLAKKLEDLAENLRSANKSNSYRTLVKGISEKYGHLPKLQEIIDKLKLKGVFCYDYVSSLAKLMETKLPPIEEFYNELNDLGISKSYHDRAVSVYEDFGCKNIMEYMELYLLTDVFLLADIFEAFRDVCIENYKLDPLHYYTIPGLSWDAMLKYTDVTLDLLTDPNMHLMVEKGIRGGVSMVTKRFSQANNKYLRTRAHDKRKPSVFIIYLDANNLYGYSMMKDLPVSDFRWMTESELTNYANMPCIAMVDMHVPHELAERYRDFPMAPEHCTVNGVRKLLTTFGRKDNYVIHYGLLRKYVELGMVVTKVHRGITFKESNFLSSYIELNTELRTKATNEFERDFFKFMNNSVYGKTIENVRRRVNIKLCTDDDQVMKLARKPTFERATYFGEELKAVHMMKNSVTLNKPTYLGMCILDISKELMYRFYYDYLKDKFGDRLQLIFTDTDSFCIEVRSEDFYEEIKDDVPDWFDTSNLKVTNGSDLKMGVNKKKPGFFKNETAYDEILEVVAVRPKCYSYITDKDNAGSRRMKGVKSSAHKQVTHEMMKQAQRDNTDIRVELNKIESRRHEVFSVHMNKLAVSPNDDKVIVQEDRIRTLPYYYPGTVIPQGVTVR